MSIWKYAPRLATSSRCLHGARFLVGESSSSTAVAHAWSRHKSFNSTNLASDSPLPLPLPATLPSFTHRESQPISATNSPPSPPSDNALGKKSVDSEGDENSVAKKLYTGPPKLSRNQKRKKRRAGQRTMNHKSTAESLETKTMKQAKPTFDSQLVPENWREEPWTGTEKNRINVDKPSSNEYRSHPPHTPPTDLLRQGVIEAQGDVLTDVAPRSEHMPVATLSHGLDRTLFNPGVHWLRDPRSHVYNFTPWLENIPKVNDFAFERLTGFIKSSRDEDLRALAKQENKKFAGSTSSLSGMLSHIYFLLSEYKEADCSILSQHFRNESAGFTSGQRMPAMVMLNYKDGIYAIDSHSAEWDDPDKNVLTWMGTLLENFLTKTPEEFKTFMRKESAPIQQNETSPLREAFRFAKSDKFVMRSQLDCRDDRLPGTGIFDIKTRACVSIRMDILNYAENAGYLIKSQHGMLESFEREYYDLIRSAFLKYNFQVRIGNMDGVMVAYHNTERIFGFQYISRDEMDERIYGPTPGIGDKVFNHSIRLLEAILEEASKCFPEQSVLCGFETPLPGKTLDIFVQPAEWTGDENERPIAKLAITLEHELDGIAVRASTALRTTNEQWNVNYQISRVVLSDLELRNDLNSFHQRKKRSLVLPSSVSLEDAEEYWNSLNFSNKMPEGQVKLFRPEAFSLASASIEKYRELARDGRLLSKKLEEDLAEQPKIVLGKGVYKEEQELCISSENKT